jgi:hypothetical protein
MAACFAPDDGSAASVVVAPSAKPLAMSIRLLIMLSPVRSGTYASNALSTSLCNVHAFSGKGYMPGLDSLDAARIQLSRSLQRLRLACLDRAQSFSISIAR